jgi:exopolyphosphatase/guanosine-5'-triphosphate,3'-diphosphate pyrophosphatase
MLRAIMKAVTGSEDPEGGASTVNTTIVNGATPLRVEIANSDIFGLAKDSMKIISQIALYHRGAMTQPTDDDFYTFSRQERTLVLKLASILRIADSLDRSHSQRVENFDITFGTDTMIIHTKENSISNLEKMAVAEKSDLFEFVFGYTIIMS